MSSPLGCVQVTDVKDSLLALPTPLTIPQAPWVVLETLRLMADSHTLGLSQVGSRPAGEPRRTAGISGSLWASRGAAMSSYGTYPKQEQLLGLLSSPSG